MWPREKRRFSQFPITVAACQIKDGLRLGVKIYSNEVVLILPKLQVTHNLILTHMQFRADKQNGHDSYLCDSQERLPN